jgi:hypothetical protein
MLVDLPQTAGRLTSARRATSSAERGDDTKVIILSGS